jgi:phosphoribosylcarboxyaminoimidazole (NCAIR) mutase
MKFLSVLVFLAISHETTAFSPVKSSRRVASRLLMNVETNDQKTIKVGVIGAGRIGVVHLEAITKAPGVVPVIISNPTISKAEKGEKAFSILQKVCR